MKKYEEMRNEYEEMKRGCVMDFDTSSFYFSFLIVSPFSFVISHLSTLSLGQEMAPAIMPDAEQRFAQSLSRIIVQESQVAT